MDTNALRIEPLIQRTRLYQSDEFRQRALERLYERKAALDALIASLELYERVSPPTQGRCGTVSEMPKCS
jgi:hypothetical protein